jgi:hypothetical protein
VLGDEAAYLLSKSAIVALIIYTYYRRQYTSSVLGRQFEEHVSLNLFARGPTAFAKHVSSFPVFTVIGLGKGGVVRSSEETQAHKLACPEDQQHMGR